MSEPDNFLTRWSRRKQEAERGRQDSVAPPDKREDAEEAGEPGRGPAAAPKQEAEFDLSKLPSLDSITAGTDVRVFLQKGVPAELTRAALRRAWSADPAIRDFIEVAENQWDFATGSDIPGFGPLEASEDLRRMVSSMFEPPAKPQEEAGAQKPENSDQAETDARSTAADAAPEDAKAAAASADTEDRPDEDKRDFATQHESHDPEIALPTRKRHGSALPE
jgi:hypothetical protein